MTGVPPFPDHCSRCGDRAPADAGLCESCRIDDVIEADARRKPVPSDDWLLAFLVILFIAWSIGFTYLIQSVLGAL